MAKIYHAFLSYTRFDDQHSGGRISRLRDMLVNEVQAASGNHEFEIFQDVDGIGAGDHWPSLLEQMIDEARFFIPVLTPSYFNSSACREELERFVEGERKAGRRDLILPILFRHCPALTVEARREADDLAKLLHERNYVDWIDLRRVNLDAVDSPPAVEALAEKIAERFVVPTPSRSPRRPAAKPEPAVPSFEKRLAVLERENADLRRQLAEAHPAPFVHRTEREPLSIYRDIDEPWCPEMVVIPAGSFMMGSPEGEEGRHDDEGPQRRINFTEPFAMGRYPVTFAEYDHFCEESGRDKPGDEGWGRGRRPVIYVTWHDARDYVGWLSEVTKKAYRLPSEAEWEYACRAGTTTRYSFGDKVTEKLANLERWVGKTIAVGSYPANPWKFHDMHGNVVEWCEDHWHESYAEAPDDGRAWVDEGAGESSSRVVRGGSWLGNRVGARCAARDWDDPDDRVNDLGFRVVCSSPIVTSDP